MMSLQEYLIQQRAKFSAVPTDSSTRGQPVNKYLALAPSLPPASSSTGGGSGQVGGGGGGVNDFEAKCTPRPLARALRNKNKGETLSRNGVDKGLIGCRGDSSIDHERDDVIYACDYEKNSGNQHVLPVPSAIPSKGAVDFQMEKIKREREEYLKLKEVQIKRKHSSII